MNDNNILACILFAKSQGLACADKAVTDYNALMELINGLTADGWMQSAEGGSYCIGCGNEETQGHAADCKYVAVMSQ